jgi:glycerophosphoryl diester phosphodiesterase
MTPPLLLGHRGARAFRDVPENTLESFELCLRHGCDGFEFDVRRSADGQAVICHDAVTRGMVIAKTTASALALPTLGDVLSSFGRRAFLDIELKVAGLEEQTIGLLREHSPSEGYVVSSFKPEVLTALRQFDSTIPLGFISDRRDELERWQELPAAWVIPQFELVDPMLIDKIQASGKKVMVWTVNRQDQMRRSAKSGVDAIISDDTELSVQILAGR